MSNNEMAKLHIRYMVGGICKEINDERIYRFMFPEKPGELLKFLDNIGSRWNISLSIIETMAQILGEFL